MFLTEDREIVNIYNRKILVEHYIGSHEIYNPDMLRIFSNLIQNPNNKTRIYNKIDTHIQNKTQGSGSMFLHVTDAVDLLKKIFDQKNNNVTWKKYGNVGGRDHVGYYAIIPNVTGLIGNLTKSQITPTGATTLQLKDTNDDSSHYGIQATVRINPKKLTETHLITMIFYQSGDFSSMYPGPQSSNLYVDKNTGITDPNIKAGNKISKTIFKKDLYADKKPIIPYFRAI